MEPETQESNGEPTRPVRLRVAVALVLLWWVPFWLLGPRIAGWLSGIDNPPSGATVTTAIVVVQTIVGLVGFWLGGTEVKAIVRRSTKKRAFKVTWSVLLHGEIPDDPRDSASADVARPPPSSDLAPGQARPDDG